jgi:hypothetical protein
MTQRDHNERLSWDQLYREAELFKAAVRLYTKPLFDGRKALSVSTDGRTLYDFARHGLRHLDSLHGALSQRRFQFGPALALRRNFNGKRRTLYVYSWEERLVSLLLYRLLNRSLDGRFSRSCYAYRHRGYGVDCCQRQIVRALRTMPRPVYVVKRDICDFFGSLDHELLLGKLKALVRPDDYLFRLLAECVQFRFVDGDRERLAQRGVPFGSAIACLFANLYLMDLDRRLERVADLRFFRYADDLLVLASTRQAAERAAEIFRSEMSLLGLRSKPSHELDLLLDAEPRLDGQLRVTQRFRHLGLEFRSDGSVGLGRDKFRKIRNLFRFAFRRYGRRFRRLKEPEKRAALAIDIASRTIHRGVRNVAIIDYYLKHVTDEAQLRQLDRWLAEEVLSLSFGGGHKKGRFRKLPFSELRRMGLPSLVHRRRLLVHGHLPSPFFVWKNSRLQRGSGGRTARSKPVEGSAFSQGPEAVSETTS